jgi:hypothetical protein
MGTASESKGKSSQTGADSAGREGRGPAENVTSLSIVVGQISERLARMENLALRQVGEDKPKPGTFLEMLRIIFGGWPALGLVFLVLFYGPLREALNAIPEKVKAAENIDILGVSLKSTIREEAKRIGAAGLSETLPALSPEAVGKLLRSSRIRNPLTAVDTNDAKIIKVRFVDDKDLQSLEELEKQNLVEVVEGSSAANAPSSFEKLRQAIQDFKLKYPGTASKDINGIWLLNTPTQAPSPEFTYHLTEQGQKAVNVIINAISTELAPKSTAASNKSR